MRFYQRCTLKLMPLLPTTRMLPLTEPSMTLSAERDLLVFSIIDHQQLDRVI